MEHKDKNERIKGLDSIRFLCAVFVLFAHLGLLLPTNVISLNPRLFFYLQKFLDCLFNGPAAVIIFFIISGFCIHYPFVFAKNIKIIPFYIKRLLRISLPAMLMVCLYSFLHIKLNPPHYNSLWSIICEIIYYLLYPIVLFLSKKIKLIYIIFAAYIVAIVMLLINANILRYSYQSYSALGNYTWIIGLPCWLLGCWLAENYKSFASPSLKKIWLWRLLIITLFVVLRIVKSHVKLIYGSNCFTLDAFAILGCIWVGYEIANYKNKEPNKLLELSGKWSYSLYLIHPAAATILLYIGFKSFQETHIYLILGCFVVAYMFYLLIEKPTHLLAFRISQYFTK